MYKLKSFNTEAITPSWGYHISERELESLVLHPRVPEGINEITPGFEDETTPRVCFSSSVDGCLKAIGPGLDRFGKWPQMFVYVPITEPPQNNIVSNKILVSKKLVMDANISEEFWVVNSIAVKLIGTIQILDCVMNQAEDLSGEKLLRPSYRFRFTPLEFDNSVEVSEEEATNVISTIVNLMNQDDESVGIYSISEINQTVVDDLIVADNSDVTVPYFEEWFAYVKVGKFSFAVFNRDPYWNYQRMC